MNIYEAITSFYDAHVADDMDGVPLYLGAIPQGLNPPATTFSLVSGVPIVTHDGESATRRERFQFNGISTYLGDAIVIRENFRKLLKTLPDTYGDLVVQSCVPTGSPRDLRDDVNMRWNAQQDFLLYYTIVTGGE
jgi:hypothetical protein